MLRLSTIGDIISLKSETASRAAATELGSTSRETSTGANTRIRLAAPIATSLAPVFRYCRRCALYNITKN